MLICGIDFETNGLDVTTARVIEIGAVLWDTTRKTPLGIMSTFVDPDLTELPEEITKITGITLTDITTRGIKSSVAFQALNELINEAQDCIVAHNGEGFDKPVYLAECARCGISPAPHKWIDTSIDVQYPETIRTRKLSHLAAEHGFLNPFPHRAVTDVLTMLRLLSCYSIEDVVRLASEPTITLVAITKKPWLDTAPEGKKETDLARARGFRWDGARKQWLKNVKKSQVEAECSASEFAVKILE